MPGRLTVCPTPIGNLEDLSPRARRALGEADLVACEDTRRTGLLFERLEIHRPRLVSYHEGNEAERAVQLAQQVERGAKVALISEAGTPVISDPGYRPGGAGELERVLPSAETVVAFESPRRLPQSLAALAALAPNRPAAVCRELTKLHEEVARGTLGELARRFRDEVKGEIVVVLAPAASGASAPEIGFAVDALRRLVQSGARPRAAASVVAALTGTRANDLYRALTGRDPRE